jgi:hypothetical protein
VKDCPYVGPVPFTESDASRFCGRDAEVLDLAALIEGHALTLLYAPSGAGKTSLLNAGIVTRLRARGLHVHLPVRIGAASSTSVDAIGCGNAFTANLIANLMVTGKYAVETCNSFQHYAERYRGEVTSQSSTKRLTIIMIDQFEELFTKFSDRWRDRDVFLRDLGGTLAATPRLRVVLAMREEYLASLEPYAELLPDALQVRFRLSLLRESAALQAIITPAAAVGVTYQEAPDDAAMALVDALRRIPDATGKTIRQGEYIEPLQLQVVCRSLWGKLPDGTKIISRDYVNTLGDVNSALQTYYEETVRAAASNYGVEEGVIRNWIEKTFILRDATRSLVPGDSIGNGHDGVIQKVIEGLTEVQLLRAEVRGDRQWFELSHDRFVGVVQQSNESWRNNTSDRRALLDLTAANWASRGRPSFMLLNGQQLKEASVAREGRGIGAFAGKEIDEFMEASKNALQSAEKIESERRKRRIVTMCLLALVVAISFLILSYVKSSNQSAVAYSRGAAEAAQHLASREETRLSALMFAIRAVGTLRIRGLASEADSLHILKGISGSLGDGDFVPMSGDSVNTARLSENGRFVLTANASSVFIWDVDAHQEAFKKTFELEEHVLDAHFDGGDNLVRVEISGKGQNGGHSGPPRWWSISSREELSWPKKFSSSCCCRFSGDGKTAFMTDASGGHVLDAKSGEVVRSFPVPKLKSGAPTKGLLAFVGGGKYVAFTELASQRCTLWRATDGEYRYTLDPGAAISSKSTDKYAVGSFYFSNDASVAVFLPKTSMANIYQYGEDRGGGKIVTWVLGNDNEGTRSSRRTWNASDLQGVAQFVNRKSGLQDSTRVLIFSPISSKVLDINPYGAPADKPIMRNVPENEQKLAFETLLPMVSFGSGGDGADSRLQIIGMTLLGDIPVSAIHSDMTPNGISSSGRRMLLLRGSSYAVVRATIAEGNTDLDDEGLLLERSCRQLQYQPDFTIVKNYCENGNSRLRALWLGLRSSLSGFVRQWQ